MKFWTLVYPIPIIQSYLPISTTQSHVTETNPQVTKFIPNMNRFKRRKRNSFHHKTISKIFDQTKTKELENYISFQFFYNIKKKKKHSWPVVLLLLDQIHLYSISYPYCQDLSQTRAQTQTHPGLNLSWEQMLARWGWTIQPHSECRCSQIGWRQSLGRLHCCCQCWSRMVELVRWLTL